MIIQAAIEALEALPPDLAGHDLKVFSDSKYLIDGMSLRIHDWKKNGWTTAGGKPVRNQDLLIRLDAAQAPHVVEWKWLAKGSNNEAQEIVDVMARMESGASHSLGKITKRQKQLGEI